MQATGSTENNYLYRGEQVDPNLGMQYLRARYYDQNSGRFASVDPFEGKVEQPILQHRYLYTNNNPVSYGDPSGKITSILEAESTFTLLELLGTLGVAVAAQTYLAATLPKDRNWNGSISLIDVPEALLGFGLPSEISSLSRWVELIVR